MRLRQMYAYLVYALVAAVLIFGLGPILWNTWRERQLQAEGLRTRAEVLSMADTRSRLNGNPVVELRLRVMPETGPPYPATVRTAISPVDLPRVQPGLSVDVMVDRKDPDRVALAARP